MAKLSMKLKQQAEPKFSTRRYIISGYRFVVGAEGQSE